MKRETWYMIGGLSLAVILLLMRKAWLPIATRAIQIFESFRSTPYWDVSRYSWGYGTQAPGPTGTISKAQALADATKVLLHDYEVLSPQVTRKLRPGQWGAFLSFSYNEGTGNADNLLANINSGDDQALETQWKKYVYYRAPDGTMKVSQSLVDRRAREWLLWSENIL